MKNVLTFFSVILLNITIAVAACTLSAPADLKAKNITSCQFMAKWKKVNNAIDYRIQYRKSGVALWTEVSSNGNVDSYQLNALDVSTTYEVKIAAVCINAETGIFSAPITVTTLVCSAPVDLKANGITTTTANISWSQICDAPKFTLRYRMAGTVDWYGIKSIPANYYVMSGLQPNTTYEIKVESKCKNGDSEYSSSIFFTTLSANSAKNILLIIVDDARYDSYNATGGPSFLNDINISRIALEGVNFTQAFSALSMCAPSRGTLMTGLYPHLHGITDNVPSNENQTLSNITFPEILHNHGYFNGLIGKYHISTLPQPGFDYWMEGHSNKNVDANFNVNGIPQTIPGHITDVVTDSALAFFNKVPDGQPFFLWLAYKAPHLPPVPRIEEEGIYDNVAMPFPENFYRYETNIPQFNYKCHSYGDSTYVEEYYRGYFELLKGVEIRLGDIFNALTIQGLIDSTLIIFMSDNGYMMGEHMLMEKQLPYEESIRIPLFMRYPSEIESGTIISDQLAMNLDIAPTILDFAGIADTFGFQGVSLLEIINGETGRDQLLYEFINKECVPDLRGVRTHNYKYITYNCTETTEEFFDLVNDPQENINLFNDPAYTTLLQEYRNKLVYLRNYYQDFSWDSLYECSLTNPERLTSQDHETPVLLNTFPNPVSAEMMVHFLSSEKKSGSVQIVNAYGVIVWSDYIDVPFDNYLSPVSVAHLPAGNYLVLLTHGNDRYKHLFIVQE
jgi:N-acetylglucosamine-6-sulfatase